MFVRQIKQNQDKGFTLVELVIVMMLISVFVAITTFSLSTVFNTRAKKAAGIVDEMMSQCKIYNLSGRTCFLRIYQEDGNTICELDGCTVRDSEDFASVYVKTGEYDYRVISDDSITVTGKKIINDSSRDYVISKDEGNQNELILSYDHVTGAFTAFFYREKGTDSTNGTDLFSESAGSDTVSLEQGEIVISRGAKVFTIEMNRLTGLSELEQEGA